MLQQVNYNQILQTINRLNYSDKRKLFNHLKRLINSDNKTRPAKNRKSMSWLGCLEGQTEIPGDIIAPVMPEITSDSKLAGGDEISILFNPR